MQQPSLEQLNDIIEPGQAGWWPPSWLTIAVVATLLAGVLVLATVLFRRWQKSKVRKAAMKQLLQQKDANIEQITVLLKRAALAYYPRELVATKHSRTWLVFLLAPLSNNERASFEPLLQKADKNFYGTEDNDFNQNYYQLARLWLSKDLSKQPGVSDV
ncbi:MAG: hypothetical protein CMF11_02610 [Idiomarina sp.]|nr:hypothetical protein [Idiomarina sp.]